MATVEQNGGSGQIGEFRSINEGGSELMAGHTGKLATMTAVVGTVLGAFFMQTSIEDRVAGLETRVAALESEIATDATAESLTTETHDLRGSVSLIEFDGIRWLSGNGCQGKGGYDDLRLGADVVVSDGQGQIIASGSLGEGEKTEGTHCTLPFFIEDVPITDFYSIDISNRGELTYSHAEIQAVNWTLDLSIGG